VHWITVHHTKLRCCRETARHSVGFYATFHLDREQRSAKLSRSIQCRRPTVIVHNKYTGLEQLPRASCLSLLIWKILGVGSCGTINADNRYSCLATFIILSKNNWSLLSLCFTLSLESTPSISSSTSFWHQFLHFRLSYSFTHHFFLFWFTHLLIHYPSLLHPGLNLPVSPILPPVVSLLPPGLPSRIIARTISSELFGFCY